MFERIFLGAPDWLPVAGILMTVALAILIWSYRQSHLTSGSRLLALGLKMTGLLLLALCLVEPLISGTRPVPGANRIAILADNSQSLQIVDPVAREPRGKVFKSVLENERADWRVRLNQDFQVRKYLFGDRLSRTENFAELRFDGHASSLAGALVTLAERSRGQNLAGIVLFTDGNLTDGALDDLPLDLLPPVYPVLLDSTAPLADLAVAGVSINQTSFEDAPVTVHVEVTGSGLPAATPVVARLLDEHGLAVIAERGRLPDDGKPLVFRLQLRPPQAGVSFYQLQVVPSEEGSEDPFEVFRDPKRSPEASLANNQRLLAVDRGRGPYRVLYVSGRPNWEFKFLNRALAEDREVDLVGLIRIAKREPKFEFRSRAGESSNPLFRGFKKTDDEETERYDQPVLVRLGTRDDRELRDGFPKSEKELFGYRAIVLDDVEAEFFNRDQMALLERFVSERGGGLLMLGGQESFAKGRYQRTPIERLLPIYLNQESGAPTSKYRLSLSREGWLAPWVRLRKTEQDERERLEEMPGFVSVHRIRGIKPGATPLAYVADQAGTTYPALVAHRFGNGRAAALTVADLWRWQLQSQPNNDDLGKAWRQLVRWLVADVPDRVGLEYKRDSQHGGLRLSVRARNTAFEPLDNASCQVTVTGPDGKPLRVPVDPSLEEAGLFIADFSPRQPGAYRAKAEVRDADGKRVGDAETGWTANPAADEFRQLTVNRELLEELARRTQGEVITIDKLESLAKSLPTRKLPAVEQTNNSLWHRASVFILALLCLMGEWGVRRVRGLP